MNACIKALLLLPLVASAIVSASDTPEDASQNRLKLIELYTSHGCSSCPSAEALLGELLAADDQLMALEYHVDYWDTLVHGSAGSFKDPYSKSEYSMRQREYNGANLKGRPGVYTPQAVINGRFATVGSNRRHITKALAKPVEQALAISIQADANLDSLAVSLAGSDQQRQMLEGTSISIAYYIDTATTRITGGENNNKRLVNHHIVTDVMPLGKVMPTGDMTYSVKQPGAGEGCVVLVQEGAKTPVYAAAACP